MSKLKKIFIIILAFVSFLGLTEIVLCNSLPDKGRRIDKIEEEAKTLEEENQKLQIEISESGSLTRVKEKAETTGFRKPLVIHLRKDAEIAFEP